MVTESLLENIKPYDLLSVSVLKSFARVLWSWVRLTAFGVQYADRPNLDKSFKICSVGMLADTQTNRPNHKILAHPGGHIIEIKVC